MLKVLPLDDKPVQPIKDPKSIEKYKFIYHFLPHPHTKKRATLLSNKALTIYCFLILLIFGLFKAIPKVAPGVLGYASSIYTKELLEHTNKKREAAGLKPLKLNTSLSRAAQKKAEDMFADGYWAHISPDGTEPWDFILGEKYDYSYAGENLAKNFNNSKEVVEAWYNSPSHRDNLLNENYDELGFAIVNGTLDGYQTTLVVQMFGRQRQPSFTASLLPDVVPSEPEITNVPVTIQITDSSTDAQVLPAIDVKTATRTLNFTFGGFIVSLLSLDMWYSRRKSIPKFTGHSFVHVSFLILILLGFWFALSPGKIL